MAKLSSLGPQDGSISNGDPRDTRTTSELTIRTETDTDWGRRAVRAAIRCAASERPQAFSIRSAFRTISNRGGSRRGSFADAPSVDFFAGA